MCESNNPQCVETHYENNNGNLLKSREYRLDGKLHRTDGPAREEWYENGNLKSREYHLNGKLHRTDGPAREEWHENGNLMSRVYCLDGKYHREDGPTKEEWYENGNLQCREYCLGEWHHRTVGSTWEGWDDDNNGNGNLEWHRTDGPAIEWWYPNGNRMSREYYLNGKRHRADGPAWEEWWHENGNPKSREYYLDGKRHRADGPAVESWYPNGNCIYREYYLDGISHRTNGPAWESWYTDGDIENVGYDRNYKYKLSILDGPIIEYQDGMAEDPQFYDNGQEADYDRGINKLFNHIDNNLRKNYTIDLLYLCILPFMYGEKVTYDYLLHIRNK